MAKMLKFESKQEKYVFFSVIALLLIMGSVVAYPIVKDYVSDKMTGGVVSDEPVSAEEIYPLFICPCCGQPLDPDNICCGAAKEMIDYINSQVNTGLSETDVIIQVVKKYGLTSLIESKRAEIETEFRRSDPDLFPTGKLSFKQALGKQAPDFSLESIDGKTIKLSDYKGKNVILFFNEGAMCYPACWNQIRELGNDERFNTNDVVAFSIVVDQKSKWEKIVEKTPGFSSAKILFDPTRAVSSAYDILSLQSSMHKGTYPGHTYFIIDREGVIQYTLDDPNMAIWNDKLANELEKLRGGTG